MPLISVHLATGREVSFQVDAGIAGRAYFVLSVRKSGSSLFNSLCEAVANHNRYRFVDVGHGFFSANVTERDFSSDPALRTLLCGGNVYGGFRSMPLALRGNEVFEESPRLLMVRDPRDALVSQYFSDAYSHPIPAAGPGGGAVQQLLETQRAYALQTEIDEYVKRRAASMRKTIVEYRSILADTNTTLLKYEDYIFSKTALIRVIAERFGWSTDDELIRKILEWADKRPTEENKGSFVRKVTPGDHREKLRKETISAISETLRPAMEMLGYSA